jgi:hypothetical protein
MNENANEKHTANSEVEKLRARVDELANQVSHLKALRNVSYTIMALGILLAAAVGWVAARLQHGLEQSAATGLGRVEMGTVPVELNRQLAVTGVVEFSKPFARKPLVFIAEAGHAGVFLACKTDAISETQFTWSAGAGPNRQPYSSELAWIAIEPK